jgi:histidinol phosphatase-like PHP family hydrolase
MTVPNIVRRCEELGFSHLGIVEKLNTSGKHAVRYLEELVSSFRSMRSPVQLYVGAELDVFHQALPAEDVRALKERLALDYYLGSVHTIGDAVSGVGEFIRAYQRLLMRIVREADWVDVIAHPWIVGGSLMREGALSSWRFADVPKRMLSEFVQAAAEHGKAIELSARADLADPTFRWFLRLAHQRGVQIAIGSDAPELNRVGQTAELAVLLRELGIPATQLWIPARKETA